MNLGEMIKGRIEGEAVVRDKHGNIKGTIKFGGDATLAEASAVSGKSEDEILAANSGQPINLMNVSKE